ncbi:MAG: chorismate mutase [Nanoarchaeota archaeon]|nr:chorismate mutase [Nanoarchaeota archaeon]
MTEDQGNEKEKINKIRRHIDRIDTVIITALAERIQLVFDIGKYKKKKELPIFDEAREIEIMDKLKAMAKEQGLEESFTEEIFLSIFNETKRIQNDIING